MFYIYTIIALLPILYPLNRLVRKMDINLFDALIIFLSINFCISPLIQAEYIDVHDTIFFDVFLVYSSLIYSLLVVDVNWSSKKKDEINIINISSFLKLCSRFVVAKKGYVLLLVLLCVLALFYLPYATIAAHFDEKALGIESYRFRMTLSLLRDVLMVTGLISSYNMVVKINQHKISFYDVFLALLSLLLFLFCSRRDLVFFMIEFAVLFFSICRDMINKRIIILGALLASLVFVLYFPFYDVMRNNAIEFDVTRPISSFSSIVAETVDSYSSGKSNAKESTEKRSTYLYAAVSDMLKYSDKPMCGKATLLELDMSIPRFLNPNKGTGSQAILESMTKRDKDQSDSLLLEGIADFGRLGGVYTLLLYLVVFTLYSKYQRAIERLLHSRLASMYVGMSLLSVCWNVEVTFGKVISWIFSSLIVVVFLCLLERFRFFSVSDPEG